MKVKTNKYLPIYNDLLKNIETGKWTSGTKLPSENELVEYYQTSRETIRKALNLLAQNGFIQKLRGKGSVVLDVSKYDFPVSGLVSFKELAQKMGNRAKTVVHEFELIDPESHIRKQLQLPPSDKVWKVIRGREIEKESIILDKDYINHSIVHGLTSDICANSIYEYVEGELNLKISFAKKEITVEEVTEEDQKYLDLKDYKHVVVVKNYVYLDDATLFQYTESRHRLDKFRFVDFARR
jgi:GntR family transcriptional regulator, trehalose operon transcriptional repressor